MSDKTNVKLGPEALGNVSGPNKDKGKPEKYNTAIGYHSMFDNIKGNQNTGSGAFSLKKNTISHNNTAVGFNSLINSTGNKVDGQMKGNNTALGARTGEKITTGISNVLIGKQANVNHENAINRVVIGANAIGNDNHSVTLGDTRITQVNMSQSKKASINCGIINVYNKNGKKTYSLPNVDGQPKQVLKTDGEGNVVWSNDNEGGGGATDINGLEDGKTTYDSKITSNAEGEITIGNMFLGENVGNNIISSVDGNYVNGTRITALGFQALQNSVDSDNSTAFGYRALRNDNGYGNTAIGCESLKKNNLGVANTAVGSFSLTTNTTGNYNVSIGEESLRNNTTGSLNSAIGHNSMKSNTIGKLNTAIGNSSLNTNTTGNNNTALGHYALYNNTTGNNNTALGNTAGDKITTGKNNVIIGKGADVDSEDAENRIVIGQGALAGMNHTVSLGNSDVTDVYMGQLNQATVNAGGFAIYYNNTFQYALPVIKGSNGDVLQMNNGSLTFGAVSGGGASSLNDLSDVLTDSAINSEGFNDGSIYIGSFPSNDLYDNLDNVSVGYNNLTALTTGNYNVAVGNYCLQANTEGFSNTAIGGDSLNKNTTGCHNTALGFQSLPSNTIGEDNTAVGSQTMSNNTSGSFNTSLGKDALGNNTSGSDNTASGYSALYYNTTGEKNTASGYQALYFNTTGSNNIALGYQAGDKIKSGNNNIIIGKDADVDSEDAENRIVIGQGATGQADNSVILGNAAVQNVYMSQDSGATVHCAGLTNTAGDGLQLITNRDTNEKILIKNQQGTSADSIKLESTNNGGINLASATTLSSTLSVTGATTLSSTLGVTGAITCGGTISGKRPVQTGTSQNVGASGNILIGNTDGALTFTLPAINLAPAGTFFTFIATSTEQHIIQTNSNETKLQGSINTNEGFIDASTLYARVQITNIKKITLDNPIIGDKIEIISDGTNFIVSGLLNNVPNLE